MHDKFNEYFQQYIYKLGHRFNSIAMAFNWYLENGGKTIVETGTSRIIGNFQGDGCFSVLAGEVAKATGTRLWTCDLLEDHINACKFMTTAYQDNITYVVGDSVEFLSGFSSLIDLFYIDSMDFIVGGDPNPAQDHAVAEYLAAKPHLHDKSIVVIDDAGLPGGGKAGKVVPLMVSDGWKVIYNSYQVVLIR